MPTLKHTGAGRVAYGEVKFTKYSRGMVAKARPFLAGKYLPEYDRDALSIYEEAIQEIEKIGPHDDNGYLSRCLNEAEIEAIENLERTVRFLLEDELGLPEKVVRDIQPKWGHVQRCVRGDFTNGD